MEDVYKKYREAYKEASQNLGKRHTIIVIPNAIIMTPISFYPAKIQRSCKYIYGYEPKKYRIHGLLIKISRDLLSDNGASDIKIAKNVEILVRDDYRILLKTREIEKDGKVEKEDIPFFGWKRMLTIMPSKYQDLQPLYVGIYQFEWRSTTKGGTDSLQFTIPECPVITKADTISNVCYKEISYQSSGTGTHGTKTFLVVAKEHGYYEVGIHHWSSNYHKHYRDEPYTVTL